MLINIDNKAAKSKDNTKMKRQRLLLKRLQHLIATPPDTITLADTHTHTQTADAINFHSLL